ncbi:hypothetical protein ACEWY4_017566 [Coilia grayii]|uniref:Ig-like domain-containing protein n=1 Tax=Coilia grayii TaxID=363190 RepID=A0ABD1JH83_9TELE
MDPTLDFINSQRVPWTILLFLLNLLLPSEGCGVGRPRVNPTSLLVRYGDPASATCSTPFHVDLIGWEAAVGAKEEPQTQQLVWGVTSVSNWSLGDGVTCFTSSEEHGRCETHLPITIYKIPNRVTMSLLYPPEAPLIEGRIYTLDCEIQNVVPLSSLSIRWFKGDEELDISQKSRFLKRTLDKANVRTDINASREDHEASYSCAAHLDLNTTEPIPDTRSNSIQWKVLYKPRVLNASGDVFLCTKDKMELTCLGEANPMPSYQWRHQGVALAGENETTLVIESVNGSHNGLYECLIRNTEGDVTVSIRVSVKGGNVTLHILFKAT